MEDGTDSSSDQIHVTTNHNEPFLGFVAQFANPFNNSARPIWVLQ